MAMCGYPPYPMTDQARDSARLDPRRVGLGATPGPSCIFAPQEGFPRDGAGNPERRDSAYPVECGRCLGLYLCPVGKGFPHWGNRLMGEVWWGIGPARSR